MKKFTMGIEITLHGFVGNDADMNKIKQDMLVSMRDLARTHENYCGTDFIYFYEDEPEIIPEDIHILT